MACFKSARMKASYVHEVACGGLLGRRGFLELSSHVWEKCAGPPVAEAALQRGHWAQPRYSNPCGFAQKHGLQIAMAYRRQEDVQEPIGGSGWGGVLRVGVGLWSVYVYVYI